MANCSIGYRNWIDGANLSAGAELSTAKVTNLQNPQISRSWQSGNNSSYILADLITTTPGISIVVLAGTNLTAAATRQIRLSSVDTTGIAGDVHNSGAAAAGIDARYGMLVYFFPSALNGRYLRVDLADTTVTNIKVGRWAALTAWTPAKNFQLGWERYFDDTSLGTSVDDGGTFYDRGVIRRGLIVTLAALSKSEADIQIPNLAYYASVRDDILLCLDSASTNLGRDSIWGPMQAAPRMQNPFKDLYSITLNVLERK